MSGEKADEIDIMYGLKTVLFQIEAAVARRSKVSELNYTLKDPYWRFTILLAI